MKRTFLVLIASALILSCGKQPACPPVVHPSASTELEGCWFGNFGTSICFTDSVLSKDNAPFHAYHIFNDTIHVGLLVEMYTFVVTDYVLILHTVRNGHTDTFLRHF